VNKALLDTDIYSEVLKAINPTVAQNAANYRQTHGVLTLSVITTLEIVKGCQQAQATGRMQRFLSAPLNTRPVAEGNNQAGTCVLFAR
jgi:tRNA(fMet)-specific endonuclease VapC